MHPFLDAKKLTDEELIDKIGKARLHMNAQIELGHTPTVNSIREVLEALELEQETRMSDRMNEKSEEKNADDLSPIDIGKLYE